MIGNRMNTQSCFNAHQSSSFHEKSAVEKLRAGFTDVLSIGMLIMWTRASIRPIGMPAKPAIADDRVVPAITRMNSAVKHDLGDDDGPEREAGRRVVGEAVRRAGEERLAHEPGLAAALSPVARIAQITKPPIAAPTIWPMM